MNDKLMAWLTCSWNLKFTKISPLKPLTDPLQFIRRRDWIKLLGVVFQDKPCNWAMQFKYILKKASSQLHILKVCILYANFLDII